jgi:hypothetical protein
VALGFREVRRQKTWLLLLTATWVLGLGGSLRVGGVETGFPLPYAALVRLPVLGMLRNPDRMFLLLQLSFAVLCAYAWKGLAARIASPRARGAVGAALATSLMLEFSGAPLRSFSHPCSPHLAELARDPRVESLIELPTATGSRAARYNHCQTVHEKKIPEGYVTNLAMTHSLLLQERIWIRSVKQLSQPDESTFRRRLKTRDIDLVVLNKTVAVPRRPPQDADSILWQPFGWISDRLLPARQTGAFVFWPAGDQPIRSALREALGD